MKSPFCYRKLHKYKYCLSRKYSLVTTIFPAKPVITEFIRLDKKGKLTIMKHYAWDGITGAPDHPHNMRASLVHDALYQLMRLGKLDYKTHRETADDLFYELCMQDKAVKAIAKAYRLALKLFGEKHAKPGKEEGNKEICR